MPYMTNGKRDYDKQKKFVDSAPAARKHRSELTTIGRAMVKAGKSSVGDGLDNSHKKAFSKGGSPDLKNIFEESPAKNRSFSRNPDSSLKSEKSKRERKK